MTLSVALTASFQQPIYLPALGNTSTGSIQVPTSIQSNQLYEKVHTSVEILKYTSTVVVVTRAMADNCQRNLSL